MTARNNLLSIESTFRLRLDVAKALRSAPRFFYPHNTDFRGRAYPLHPYLNHMGDDAARGLLLFAEARPLGPTGLDWLLVHVANTFGHGEDKKSLAERREFARRHMAKVVESAVSPLKRSSVDSAAPWWMQGESPWQLLATCIEVQRAMASGSPERYTSCLPVHQDGSFNGMQHYAALARDKACASAVNMLPLDRPQDVYSTVSAAVEQQVCADAAAGRGEAIKLLRGIGGSGSVEVGFEGGIGAGVDRKLIKQTVMTTVYGVTHIGAGLQIGNRLSERGWKNEAEIWKVLLNGCFLAFFSIARWRFHPRSRCPSTWQAAPSRALVKCFQTPTPSRSG